MNPPVKKLNDVCAGAMFILFGAVFAIVAAQYPLGSLTQMGPGYFPLILAGLLSAIGAVQVLRNIDVAALKTVLLQREVMQQHLPHWRTFGLVVLAVLLFGLFAEQIGFAAATLLLTVISGFAYQQAKLREVALLAPVLTTVSVIVFSFGMDLPLPVLPLLG